MKVHRKWAGILLLELLVAITLVGLVMVGYLQLSWHLLRRQNQLLWQQRARLMLVALREKVGAESWLLPQIAASLPQGKIESNNEQWEIRWCGGRASSDEA